MGNLPKFTSVDPTIKKEGLLAAVYAARGSAACERKGEQQPRRPGVRGMAPAGVTIHLGSAKYIGLQIAGPVAARAPGLATANRSSA